FDQSQLVFVRSFSNQFQCSCLISTPRSQLLLVCSESPPTSPCRFFAQIGKCIYHAVQHLGNPFCFTVDPFADANADDSGAGTKEYVHIRIQQRNGRKSLTTVQGLKKEFSYNKILKDLKREFCCNGTVVQDPELGQVIVLPLLFDVIQLQGDQRKNVSNFLVQVLI
ncbi:hypothetical protein BHM03_00027305, partial [Ensete ventricosum]